MQLPFRRQCENPGFFLETFSRAEYADRAGMRPQAIAVLMTPPKRSTAMTLMTVKYLGDLHTECTHLASGAAIVTDAPVDNQGKGEAFSPTDLCALSLAACAVTTMGMYGQAHDCDIAGATVRVEKVMAANPRRIAAVNIVFTMPDKDYTDKQKQGLERAALACPVHRSLHPDMEKNMIFAWAR